MRARYRSSLVPVSLLAAGASLSAQTAFARERPVAPSVETVLSTPWAKGSGHYRVVVFQASVDPCFHLESVRSASTIEWSKRICSLAVDNETFKLNATQSASGVPVPDLAMSDFKWTGQRLSFQLDVNAGRATGARTYFCHVEDLEGDLTGRCKTDWK